MSTDGEGIVFRSGGASEEADASPELNPLLTHHILNSLGWRELRPLQKAAIQPVQSGCHALIVAPTAGGKTEAAVFPILSRMLDEDWRGLSVLYLCPLRALLNNLHPRVHGYAQLVGRRAGLWHGDIGESPRDEIRNDPPDILLTTPESIEAMLISRKTDHGGFFRGVRAIIVDEIHAFAGDDRGWHLMAVAERVQRIAGRPLQRIGLSATVGNAPEILHWLTRTSAGPSVVLEPPRATDAERPNVTVDFVASLDNAATVISRLHRGEKRLAFVDSRARVEELAATLRDRGVTTFVSHGSLGREERRAAEEAFSSSRDCVIVATSTLELGIDVGDLDRVIQIDAPPAVASFLQRLGRTGRRPGTKSNTLFLSTRKDSFLHTLGLLRAWADGFVEPLEPPPLPLHLVTQQLLALVLQEGGVGRHTWPEWFGTPFVFGTECEEWIESTTNHLVGGEFLFEDNGVLGMGIEGEQTFGRRHFMELMAVFSEPPMFKVLQGRNEIGQVPMRLLTLRREDDEALLLAGRDWVVRDIDWRRGIVHVEPGEKRVRAQWFGGGRGLSFPVCQGIRRVLAGSDLDGVELSNRAASTLESLRDEFSWLSEREETTLLRQGDEPGHWWTFAGSDANAWLANAIGDLSDQTSPGELSIRLARDACPEALVARLRSIDPPQLTLGQVIRRGAIDRLKFSEALPSEVAGRVVERRLRMDEVVAEVAGWNVRVVVRA